MATRPKHSTARRASSRAKAAATAASPAAASSYSYGNGYSGGAYFATQESPARGRLLTFGIDTRTQMSQWSRVTLMVKSRTLVENFGPAKSIWNLAELIGSLKPQARSGDPAWDALAEARFDAIANSPLSFDRAGKRTFYTYQTFATFRRFVDGDFFSILTETQSGAGAVAGREGHQCCNPNENPDSWNDGVRTDLNGYATAYNFRAGDTGRDYVLEPPAIHHHATWPTLGGTRGVPVLAHAINDLHDIVETNGFVKQAIKTAALMGLTRRADTSTNNGLPLNFGLGAGTESGDAFAPAGTGTVAPVKKLTFEDVFSGGLISSVPLDTLSDDRPHPNTAEFQKNLLRICAIGLNVPPSILFYMDSPGGAEIRTHLEMFDRYIKSQHTNFLQPFCQRIWTYIIAKEIKSGRLPAPKAGAEFWKVRWCPMKSITADLGRQGNLSIDLRRAGLLSDASFYESQGMDYESELRQVASEFAMRRDLETEYKLPPGSLTASLLPSNFQMQPQTTATP